MWIDPRCSEKLVYQFNEARYIARKLKELYDSDAPPQWLDDAFMRWMNIHVRSEWRAELDKPVAKIASIERVALLSEARHAIFCDHQSGPGYTIIEDTLVLHEASFLIAPQTEFACHDEPGWAWAVTWVGWPAVSGLRLPDRHPQGRLDGAIFVRLCELHFHQSGQRAQLTVKSSTQVCTERRDGQGMYSTTEILSSMDIAINVPAHQVLSSVRVLWNALIKLAEISNLGLTSGQAMNNPDYAVDEHRVVQADGSVETRDGIFEPEEGELFPEPPGPKLEEPELTLYNPDGYGNLAQEILLRLWLYEIYKVVSGTYAGMLAYRRMSAGGPNLPLWASTPFRLSPDWSDERTPMRNQSPLLIEVDA